MIPIGANSNIMSGTQVHTTAFTIQATTHPLQSQVLTAEACAFLAGLARQFEPRRRELLTRRGERQRLLDAGDLPGFLPETSHLREADWKVAPIPPDLADRRVEITGPVDRKMVINALNCGANVFMADFEDSNSPTWPNNIEGQVNLRDAVRRTISFTSPEGKLYSLAEKTAVLMVRPRGWHLVEKHFLVDGEPISASLFDFGLYFFHNAAELTDPRHRPVFLSTEARKPSRSPPLERRLPRRAGLTRHPARHHPRHRSHRNHPRRLRDGRNSL